MGKNKEHNFLRFARSKALGIKRKDYKRVNTARMMREAAERGRKAKE